MARNKQIFALYRAWNTSSGTLQAGDVANHTVVWQADLDGTFANQATGSPVDCGFGLYACELDATNANSAGGVLNGNSSTANVILLGVPYLFDYLPNVPLGNSGGLLTAGTGQYQIDTDANGRINLGKVLDNLVSVDSNNVLSVNTKYIGGTLQTARDIGGQCFT